jgi:hypothetical protein
LKLPIFVSDIDLLLQRGVKDLLDRYSGADVVLNENTVSANAGSRLTANLLLFNPTDNASRFLRFLRAYLQDFLSRAEVTRWIDQFGLMLARHHLLMHGKAPRIEYFDTAKDINNLMYPSYQENPYRFFSLYHGFDMASLEANLDFTTDAPKRRKAKRSGKKACDTRAGARGQSTAAKSRRAPVVKAGRRRGGGKGSPRALSSWFESQFIPSPMRRLLGFGRIVSVYKPLWFTNQSKNFLTVF